MTSKVVLAGDIGGTKTWLQLVLVREHQYKVLYENRFDSTQYESFEAVLRDFYKSCPREIRTIYEPQAACLGVAGPVVGNSVKITNLSWKLDSIFLKAATDIPNFRLLNDYAAVAHSLDLLKPEDLVTLQTGFPQTQGSRIVIGAGTGCGVSLYVWTGTRFSALPSEGGHVDFAPVGDLQIGLLRRLRQHYSRVCYEHILSGKGIINIYDYLRDAGYKPESPELAASFPNGDKAALITEAALKGNDPLSQATMEIFVDVFGSQAGNLTLTLLPTGGVYIAGGIVAKTVAAFRTGRFMQAFGQNRDHAVLLATVPVHAVVNEKAGLIGAAKIANLL